MGTVSMLHRVDAIAPPPFVMWLGLAAALASGSAAATDIAWGELASAIRSADFPCAQVLNAADIGDNAWAVECNSGKFRVTRDQTGQYSVSPDDAQKGA